MVKKARNVIEQNALWIAGFGLMLASSGLDGRYLASWMEWPWLGYVLNTMADATGMALTYYYGVLLRKARGSKPRKTKARMLLLAELVTVAYSWFFSWRQLVQVLPAVEPIHYGWVSWVSAAFIPLLLAAVGWAQSQIYEPAPDDAQEQTKELARLRRANAELEASNADLKDALQISNETNKDLTRQSVAAIAELETINAEQAQTVAEQAQIIEIRDMSIAELTQSQENAVASALENADRAVELRSTNAELKRAIAELAPSVLECPACGATQTQSGKPFLNKAQISAHLRHCEKHQAPPRAGG